MTDLTVAVGRPMTHDLRAMCDAVAYVVKNGIEWRALPADFPPWEAAYAFFERWNDRGLPLELIQPVAGDAAPASGQDRAAVGVHRRFPDRQGPRHRWPEDPRVPRRKEDRRARPAPGR